VAYALDTHWRTVRALEVKRAQIERLRMSRAHAESEGRGFADERK